ncbi:uncharacterized protein LOC110825167 isoform X3 [Carica papaya]|uniref:uncharacterized protein LOC110825167 isoform X3 n=1 Tax=Carica papaya TaxID=3649 RepID=UPI000B8C6F65|nr:uncharacterized protein LOC110825167 isoform X3 [Carica papaya]
MDCNDSVMLNQVSGDVSAVLKALEEIAYQLRENPPRQVISISPAYNYTSIRPPQPYLDPTSADYVTFEMVISETLVGGLIGRCGSNISRIRNESGAMIKLGIRLGLGAGSRGIRGQVFFLWLLSGHL